MTKQAISPTTPTDDAELMARMAAGDTAAMRTLYERYHRPVFSFALRMMSDRQLAEELLQEVFLRAWRQAHRFTGGRGSVISWLLSITHNMAIDELRKQQRRPRRTESEDSQEALLAIQDDAHSVEDQATQSATADVIREVLDTLPLPQRQVLELGYYKGMTQREIAEHLDEPIGTIKTRMRLAIRKLRDSERIQALDVT